MLQDKKITTYADSIKDLSDTPSEDGISADDLKALFDGRTDKEVKDSINGIIDELIAATGAANIGTTTGNVQADLGNKVDKVAGERLLTGAEAADIALNTADRHNHTNKAVLDAITSAVKGDYDSLVVLLTGIVAVSNAVANKSDEIPTSKAIVDYVTQMGGGDMLKLVYDPDGEERNIFTTFGTTEDGLVPRPGTADGKFLRDDGNWEEIKVGIPANYYRFRRFTL